jgi:hypothetical protein
MSPGTSSPSARLVSAWARVRSWLISDCTSVEADDTSPEVLVPASAL